MSTLKLYSQFIKEQQMKLRGAGLIAEKEIQHGDYAGYNPEDHPHYHETKTGSMSKQPVRLHVYDDDVKSVTKHLTSSGIKHSVHPGKGIDDSNLVKIHVPPEGHADHKKVHQVLIKHGLVDKHMPLHLYRSPDGI